MGIVATAANRSAGGWSALFCALVLLAPASISSSAVAAETYVQATVDKAGQLCIITNKRREILPIKRTDQVGFDQVAISPDGRTVGWVGLFPNCCTSYPIPLDLVIYSHGRVRTFTGNGLPIWKWSFEAQGKRVAFEQETVHGGMGVHYELRDVATGQLVAKYDPPEDKDNRSSDSRQDAPKWVTELDAKR